MSQPATMGFVLRPGEGTAGLNAFLSGVRREEVLRFHATRIDRDSIDVVLEVDVGRRLRVIAANPADGVYLRSTEALPDIVVVFSEPIQPGSLAAVQFDGGPPTATSLEQGGYKMRVTVSGGNTPGQHVLEMGQLLSIDGLQLLEGQRTLSYYVAFEGGTKDGVLSRDVNKRRLAAAYIPASRTLSPQQALLELYGREGISHDDVIGVRVLAGYPEKERVDLLVLYEADLHPPHAVAVSPRDGACLLWDDDVPLEIAVETEFDASWDTSALSTSVFFDDLQVPSVDIRLIDPEARRVEVLTRPTSWGPHMLEFRSPRGTDAGREDIFATTYVVHPSCVCTSEGGGTSEPQLPETSKHGDMVFYDLNDAGSWAILDANQSTTKKVITQVGDGAVAASPMWEEATWDLIGGGPLPTARGGWGADISGLDEGSLIRIDASGLGTVIPPGNHGEVLAFDTSAGAKPQWTSVSAVTASDFVDLGDTPSSYVSQGGRLVRVNVGETGLEFLTDPGWITAAGVTFENLDANGDVGAGASQVAQGNHSHTQATTADPGFMGTSQVDKLDSIEYGATADQTPSEILTAIKTVDGTGSGLDADLHDGVEEAALFHKDGSRAMTGDLNMGENAIKYLTTMYPALKKVSANYTITDDDHGLLVDSFAADRTIHLTEGVDRRMVLIKKVEASNSVYIMSAVGEPTDRGGIIVLEELYESVLLQFLDGKWWVLLRGVWDSPPTQQYPVMASMDALSSFQSSNHIPFGYSELVSGALARYETVAPCDMWVHSLYLDVSVAQDTGEGWDLTLLKNQVATPLSVSQRGADTSTAFNITDIVKYNEGDTIVWELTEVGTVFGTFMNISCVAEARYQPCFGGGGYVPGHAYSGVIIGGDDLDENQQSVFAASGKLRSFHFRDTLMETADDEATYYLQKYDLGSQTWVTQHTWVHAWNTDSSNYKVDTSTEVTIPESSVWRWYLVNSGSGLGQYPRVSCVFVPDEEGVKLISGGFDYWGISYNPSYAGPSGTFDDLTTLTMRTNVRMPLTGIVSDLVFAIPEPLQSEVTGYADLWVMRDNVTSSLTARIPYDEGLAKDDVHTVGFEKGTHGMGVRVLGTDVTSDPFWLGWGMVIR